MNLFLFSLLSLLLYVRGQGPCTIPQTTIFNYSMTTAFCPPSSSVNVSICALRVTMNQQVIAQLAQQAQVDALVAQIASYVTQTTVSLGSFKQGGAANVSGSFITISTTLALWPAFVEAEGITTPLVILSPNGTTININATGNYLLSFAASFDYEAAFNHNDYNVQLFYSILGANPQNLAIAAQNVPSGVCPSCVTSVARDTLQYFTTGDSFSVTVDIPAVPATSPAAGGGTPVTPFSLHVVSSSLTVRYIR